MIKTPVISVVIPTYNGEKTIYTLLQSVIMCSLANTIEIIILDSESTDRTLNEVKRINHGALKILSIPKNEYNHGLTRNIGARIAKGKYIFYFTQDAEILSKDIFVKVLEDFKIKDAVIVFGQQIPRKETPYIQKIESTIYFNKLKGYANKQGILIQNILTPFVSYDSKNKMLWYFNSDVCSCYTRSFLLANPFSKVDYGEDVVIAKQAIERSLTKVFDEGIVVKHSHNYSLLDYLSREKIDINLCVEKLNSKKTNNLVFKLNTIFRDKHLKIFGRTKILSELFIIYVFKLFVYFHSKLAFFIKNKKKILFASVLIFFQITIIAYLIVYIITRINMVNISPIKSSYYNKSEAGMLKHYYEPYFENFSDPILWQKDNFIEYGMNSDTLRSNNNFALIKQKDILRIETIGDSFTFGAFVEDQKTYPRQLEAALLNSKLGYKGVEVMNLGVAGYDIQYAIARYKKRGAKYNPDYVIWFLKDDDFLQINEIELELVDHYKKILLNSERKAAMEKYRDKYYVEYDLARDAISKKYSRSAIEELNINLVKSFAEELKNKLIIVTFQQIDKKYVGLITSICSKTKCQYVYDLPNIYKIENASFPDSHPNGKGYALIVSHIIKSVNFK